MSDQSVTRNLFDDGSGFGMKANYDLVASCVDSTTSGTNEQRRSDVTRKPMRRSSPRFGKSGRNYYVSPCTITHSKAIAPGSASPSNGLIPRPASRAAGRACRSYRIEAGKLAETWVSLLPWIRHGPTPLRRSMDEPAADQIGLAAGRGVRSAHARRAFEIVRTS